MDRRRFVTLTAASTLGVTLPWSLRWRRRGVLDRVGLQLYTVRHELEGHFERTLERVAGIGYAEVEFAGYHGRSPRAVRDVLDRVGLRAPSAHVSLESLDADWERTLDAAETIGHHYVVVAWVPPQLRRTLDDYRRLAARFARAGQAASRRGLRFAYHNHAFEFERLEGGVPYDVLADETPPQDVALQLDLFWITKAGRDPLEYFARYPGRFPSVHVKDMAPDGEMVDVGAGRIDFATIFALAGEAGIEHYFVEHDQPADAFASIRRSYEHLRRLQPAARTR